MQAMQEMLDEQDHQGHQIEQKEHGQARGPETEPSTLPAAVRMTRLAESFRSLEYKPGIRPWNAAALADWVRRGEATQAQAQAAAFVLEIANMSAVWDGVPSSKMHDAASVWSKEDRAAFAAWAQAPWYL